MSGAQTFYTQSDDGVRLWVNGVLLIDNWTDHAPTENSGTINLTAGQRYDLKMEYYEHSNGAVARLLWSAAGVAKEVVPTSQLFPSGATPPPPPPPPGTNGISASYFNSVDLTGTPVTRTDPNIDFDWGDGSPAAGIGINNFSVRWTGQVTPKVSGTQTFYTQSDDGVRLWVNGVLLIDNWTDHGPTENSGTINLTAGQRYDLKMEFYEHSNGAVARLSWSAAGVAKEVVPTSQLFPSGATPPPPPPNPSTPGLAASYFNGMALTGTPVTRVDPNLDFDWDTGSPAAGIGTNNFSARWMGKVTPKVTGTHTFYTQSDDGIRLWVNGILLVDNWTDHPPTENSNTLFLNAGQAYDLKVEYYENIGGAVAKLLWSAPGLAKEVVPASSSRRLERSGGEQGRHILRHRRDDLGRRAGRRMEERQPESVKGLAGKILAGRGDRGVGDPLPARLAVERIAHDRPPLGLQMDADLVRTSGEQPAAQQCQAGGLADPPIEGQAVLPLRFRGHPPLPVVGIAEDLELDPPEGEGCRPVDHGKVFLLGVGTPEPPRQGGVDLRRLGDQQHPRRSAVEPVDQAWTPPLLPVAGAPHQRVDQRPVAMAGRRMDDQARRLVEGEEMLVLEQHGERHLLGGHPAPFGKRRQGDLDLIA